MLDDSVRKEIDPLLTKAAGILTTKFGLSGIAVTYFGFGMGMMACLCLIESLYTPALVFLILNRLSDGLDGTISRLSGSVTDWGGYLDIVLDFIFYSAFVLSFALGVETLSAYFTSSVLLFSYMCTASAFLAFAIFAEKNKLKIKAVKGSSTAKSLFFQKGLVEGTETFLFMFFCCLFPKHFILLGLLFSVACLITAATRIHQGYKVMRAV